MQTFTKRVLIEPGFNPAFFFTKIYTIKGVRFHVSVIDMDNLNYNFNIELRSLEWKIINAPELPDWIINIEEQLQEIILEKMLH